MLFCENQSVLRIADNPRANKTHRIGMDCHTVREKPSTNLIHLPISYALQVAKIFTKTIVSISLQSYSIQTRRYNNIHSLAGGANTRINS